MIYCIVLNYEPMCAFGLMSAVAIEARRGLGSPGAGVTVSCLQPYIGTGHQLRAFCKS